jgi:DNA-binding NarL/FixJ family response regulator
MGFFAAIQPKIRTFSELTDREREILALIAQGRRNDEIAAHLCLNIKTVRNHASNIFSKCKLSIAHRPPSAPERRGSPD